MENFNLKGLEMANKEILTRAEMRNVKGGVQHICTVSCDVDSYLGHQIDYIQVPDCSHDQSAVCTAAGGTYVACVCH